MFGSRGFPALAFALLLALVSVAGASGPTSIFIDQIEEYKLLATCAELELSTIVRNMKWGCGDGGSYQSFTCFCYESSAKFSSMIGAHVMTQCPDDPSQNTTALEVFSSYCDIGGSKLAEIEAATTSVPATTSLPSSSSASSASTLQSAFSTPTSTTPISSPEPTTSPESTPTPKNTSRKVAIATGITVPVVVLASAFAAFFLVRRYKNTHGKAELYEADGSSLDASRGGTCHEVSEKAQIPAELADHDHHDPHELDAQSDSKV